MTPLEYDPQREDRNLLAAVGPACNKIKRALIAGYGDAVARDGRDAQSLERLLLNRTYKLTFNPTSKAAKRMVFGPNGVIVEGNNRNEHQWRLSGKRLELVQLDGRVHSRFNYDAAADKWTHTDDSDTLSIRGQYIDPER